MPAVRRGSVVIAVDWGTSSLRVFRIDRRGQVVAQRRSAFGVTSCSGRFEEVLAGQIEDWDDTLVVMAGMIGSRLGWKEVPYVDCPAGPAEIAQAMIPLGQTVPGRDIWLVPGLRTGSELRGYDVMRGEEAQICGSLAISPSVEDLWLCLPGTHSKLAQVERGRVVDFATSMTGELYALLVRHSVLASSVVVASFEDVPFLEGVARSRGSCALTQLLFGVRTQSLFGQKSPTALASYLSGLLIGHELSALPSTPELIRVIASPALARPYGEALRAMGRVADLQDEGAGAAGIYRLAVQRGLVAA